MESVRGTKLIRLSKSCIGDAEKSAVMHVLDHEYLGMGDEVQRFEQALGEFFGRPVVCVANGTAALHLALEACGVGVGDEVLVQSLTYVASYQAISAAGATPVSCDVESTTLTFDWRDAEQRLTPKTKAIMPVHYSGSVGQLDEIYAFANKYNLRVIEDAAHAFGTTYKSKRIGGFGDIACFSFDGIKNITSGEGGCIVTEDPVVLQKVRDARLLGVEKDTEMRYSGLRSWNFDVHCQGWRYHMSNIMAAIGIEQLKKFPQFAKRRQDLARMYDDLFFKCNLLQLQQNDYAAVVPHIYVVRLSNLINRAELQKKLLDCGIQTGVHYQPNHTLTYYKNEKNLPLPNTESIYPKLLTLPLHPDLTDSDINYVAKTLMSIL